MLGLAPDRRGGKCATRGTPPADLDLVLRGVPALGRRWDVTARGGTATVAQR